MGGLERTRHRPSQFACIGRLDAVFTKAARAHPVQPEPLGTAQGFGANVALAFSFCLHLEARRSIHTSHSAGAACARPVQREPPGTAEGSAPAAAAAAAAAMVAA